MTMTIENIHLKYNMSNVLTGLFISNSRYRCTKLPRSQNSDYYYLGILSRLWPQPQLYVPN